jgi:glutaredoxin 3
MAEVVIYASPWCGYCYRAKKLLQHKGVAFQEIDVEMDAAKRQEMEARSGRHTVPQIFIGGRHVGGSDDLHELDKHGQLDKLLGLK